MSRASKRFTKDFVVQKNPASTVTVPLVEEKISLDKKQVDTGIVRVKKIVHEHEETIEQPLHRTDANVERVSINRVIDRPVDPHYEGDVLVVPVLEEVLVVKKQWLLKEELRITTQTSETNNVQRVLLRSEEAIVEHEERSKNSNNQEVEGHLSD